MNSASVEDHQPHLPVLYQPIIHALRPLPAGKYVDGTLGAGGHAWGILNASAPDGCLLGLDVDPQAIALAKDRLAQFGHRAIICQASYTTLAGQLASLGWQQVNGILIDLGISSMQVDTPDRGFSFLREGPLDMRFSPAQGRTAADLVNSLPEGDLADIIYRYGEEPASRRIARAIVVHRPLATTIELASIISQAMGGQRGKTHPATRTFQALRMAVNEELQSLEAFLPQAIAALAPEGRLAVITFHSLEDRLVKQFFKRESTDCICPPEQLVCNCGHQAQIVLVNRHAVAADDEEVKRNPRARSAKLRIVEKLDLA
jgi:16S rRNA (cytosine1402-N4)-methyltransferase